MKVNAFIFFSLFTVLNFAQTTVQFSRTHQFFDPAEKVLTVTIVVDTTEAYPVGKPIIVELFSDLEDSQMPGISTSRSMDKAIFPEEYTNGEEIQIPINAEALSGVENFTFFLRKKGENEHFQIFRDSHAVIVNGNLPDKSYVGISIAEDDPGSDLFHNGKIEIPFIITTRGSYIPVETDKAVANIKIKENDSIHSFAIKGFRSFYTLTVDKRKSPELYKKLRSIVATKTPLELEIVNITHQSQYPIETDASKQSIRFYSKNPESSGIRLKETGRSTSIKKTDSLDARYSFYAGVNFDFNNNFKFEEAYYEMDVSLYNLFKNRWGLRIGIYKNNNSRSLGEAFRYEWPNYELIEHDETEIRYSYKTLEVATNVATESLGFYFQLPYKVIESGHFSAFVAPHIELIKRIEKYTHEIADEDTEQTIIVNVDTPLDLQYAQLWRENTLRYWDSYIGLSFAMLYRNPDKGFEVFMGPLLGTGYPRKAAESVLFEAAADPGLTFFGAFQFSLSISTKETLGFKLGADVRKYFYNEEKPTISISLSTKIDLSGVMGLAGKN